MQTHGRGQYSTGILITFPFHGSGSHFAILHNLRLAEGLGPCPDCSREAARQARLQAMAQQAQMSQQAPQQSPFPGQQYPQQQYTGGVQPYPPGQRPFWDNSTHSRYPDNNVHSNSPAEDSHWDISLGSGRLVSAVILVKTAASGQSESKVLTRAHPLMPDAPAMSACFGYLVTL